MSYRHCLLLPSCCLGVVSVFRILVFLVFLFSSICVFLVTLLALQGESAAAVLCPVGDSDPAAAALLQSQIWAQLPYTLDQGPMFTLLLLHRCSQGSKNPAEGHTSQFPGWEEGCLFDLGISAAAVEWTKTPDPTQQLWAAADQASLQEEASVHFVWVSLHVYPCLQLCLLILLSLCLPIMLYFISVCCHVQSPRKSQLSGQQTLMRKNFADYKSA